MMPSASARAFSRSSPRSRSASARLAADDRFGLDARLPDDRLGFLIQALELLARLLRVGERLADRLFAGGERLQQRTPRELREQRQQHEKGQRWSR